MNIVATLHGAKADVPVYSTLSQKWVTLPHIVGALGRSAHTLDMTFRRHEEHFKKGMETDLVQLETVTRGLQWVRVFSIRGAIKLMRYTHTPEADRMMEMLIDYLEGKASGQPRRQLSAPAPSVSTDARHLLRSVAEWPDVPDSVRTRLLEVADTGKGVSRFPELTTLAEKRLEASLGAAPFMAAINEIDRQGVAMGISRDALKTEMQLLKRLRTQPELPLENGEIA